MGEEGFCFRLLDHPRRHEQGRAVRQPPGLLHEVGHEHDGHLRLQFAEHVLDLHRRDRIDGDGELVEAEQLRPERECSGQREPLLLAAGQPGAEDVQAILDLVPEHRLAEAGLDQGVELVAVASRPGAGRRPRFHRPKAAARPAAERPSPRAAATHKHCGASATSCPSRSTSPLTLAEGMKSIVRLMHFKKVVLPELAGPMIAKICRAGISRLMSWRAGLTP